MTSCLFLTWDTSTPWGIVCQELALHWYSVATPVSRYGWLAQRVIDVAKRLRSSDLGTLLTVCHI